MGGIKNKLSKLSNKVKNLLTNNKPLPVKGGQMTKSSGGLTIHLSDHRLTSPFSQRGTKSSLPLAKGRQMSYAHRWGRITKYTSLACLTLAILSTLVLNIISSYSNSSTRSANDSACDPANTNAESCISLAITSSSSSSTGGNDPNLSLSIPQGGGIATGRHTVTVSSNNVTGYYVTLTGNAGSPAMTPTTSTSQAFIQSTTGTLTNPSSLDKGQWGSWGIALPNSSLYSGFNANEADYNSTNQDALTKTTWAAVPGKEADDGSKTIIKTTTQSRKTDAYPVYYGVRVDSPVSVPADTYTAEVVYTATTNEVPIPTISTLNQNIYELGSDTNLDSNNRLPITITGTNLQSTYSIYLEGPLDDTGNTTTNTKQYNLADYVTNINNAGTQLTATLPTDLTNSDLEAGDYTIHVVTQGTDENGVVAGFSYTEKKPLSVYDSIDNVRIDWDESMIPVYYTGSSSTPRWTSLSSEQILSNTTIWFDYSGNRTSSGKKWANAVTVKDPAKYKDKSLVVDQADIIGYWVYIPRYAYKVMRRDAIDAPASAQNFDIRFETTTDAKKYPAKTCSTTSSHRNYLDCVDSVYPTSDHLMSTTAWATHPAFTWQYTQAINGFDKTVELNGIWVGKFEMTGSTDQPTVLPQQFRKGSMPVGTLYDLAKSIGVHDQNNPYGNSTSTNKNSHHLNLLVSHAMNNNEWGAVAYLSASKYGAGVGNVLPNSSTDEGTDGDGLGTTSMTGCGPASSTNMTIYICANQANNYYYGSIGVLASTTNNVYGVYDMSGNGREFVMGIRSTQPIGFGENSSYFTMPTRRPYANTYNDADGFGVEKPAWAQSSDSQFYNNDICTWETCGGQATYETKVVQSVTNSEQSWNQDYSQFVYGDYIYFGRGGNYGGTTKAGVFSTGRSNGNGQYYDGIRVVIANTPSSH